ncbi:AAA family ATPase [Vallicoccus soli]|uniref:Chromosome partitioning protein n=1 Tax=Vallicoccus soli TaxID=2339232 RepID=A0A3A3YZC8_9ACTN|nr:chromosome partitioning protein [Vallicoccus soli]RJK95419.1 chromosome partitioning protein [Vallicoccus soli]
MSVPLLLAVTGEPWEAALVTALERDGGVEVVRRCVDVADLLAAAGTGTARAAVVSASLRRLDRDALARLAAAGVAVVALTGPGDEAAERRVRQLGVLRVLPADAAAADLAEAVQAAVDGEAPAHPRDVADPRSALADPVPAAGAEAPPSGDGRVVAVWGPAGAPGRTTLAVTLAGESARLGVPTLLADADVYGGVVAQVLGLLDESPGLAAAARAANSGVLDLPALAKLAPVVVPRLRVLTGIARADRWPELRPASLEVVLDLARRLADLTVVDCGFCLEEDEELAFDTAAPRRNGATLEVLARADTVVAVGTADPVGVQRLVRGLAELRDAVPTADPVVVLNRVRRGPVGGDPAVQLREALSRYAGVDEVLLVPEDRAGLDAALLEGRLLAEAAPGSPVRAALEPLAVRLAGVVPGRRPRLGRTWRRRAA